MTLRNSNNYELIIEPHRRALKTLELELDFFIQDVGKINLFSISSRIKQYEKAITKATRLGIPLGELDDLAGLRIVVGTLADIPVITRFFTRKEISEDLKIIKNNQIDRESGYRATHIVIEKCSSYHSSVFPGRVEVQIHTIFQHAFNFLSRNWNYKQPWETSPEWRTKFSELSRLLSSIDDEAQKLHLAQSHLQADLDSASITPYSLQLIVMSEFGDDILIEDAVDACRLYIDIGLKKNGHLRQHFRDPRIEELYIYVQEETVSLGKSSDFFQMSRYTFWSLFGTKGNSDNIKKLLDILLGK
jgi:ppGpp synthetase/RelA/SpoT-type nucleotidyltranferase